ncbi:hypothetical protein FLONG3_5438 [Fusarium longipes]|uniref:Ubiquitin-like domain-containing protein n=1 Tax=Fusarium longipes TaxID=694270 RepID=A0A395SV25_9HYPO|nr:hypothetical protein FLONG3_5438 [Fusarium longipes]
MTVRVSVDVNVDSRLDMKPSHSRNLTFRLGDGDLGLLRGTLTAEGGFALVTFESRALIGSSYHVKVEVFSHLILHIAGHQDGLPRHQLKTQIMRLNAATGCCTSESVKTELAVLMRVEIVLPSIWEKVIQPGWAVTMTMWPADKISVSDPHRNVPLEFSPSTPTEEDPFEARIKADTAAFRAMEGNTKVTEKEKETEVHIREEAAKDFLRRMEDMRLTHEDATNEIEKARNATQEEILAWLKDRNERDKKYAEAIVAGDEESQHQVEVEAGKIAQEEFESEEKALEVRLMPVGDGKSRVQAEGKSTERKDKKHVEETASGDGETRPKFEPETNANEKLRRLNVESLGRPRPGVQEQGPQTGQWFLGFPRA